MTISRKLCHRLVEPTGEAAQEAKTPGRTCEGRPKSVNPIVNVQLSK